MSDAQIHYELLARKAATGGWSLELATEDRALAVSSAEAMMKEGKVKAVKVTKETLDLETREFQTIAILTLGDQEQVAKKQVRENNEPLCITPQDLYSAHARERIGRLLEAWLQRHSATPFELMHRADLAEALEGSGSDLQHALQKVAIPEAQARGMSVHELIRTFQGLVERSIERLIKDTRKGLMPDLAAESFAQAAERVSRDPERSYLLGAAVAGAIAKAADWSDKVNILLDLADTAPLAGPPRALALGVVEQPLSEILSCRAGLDDLVGKGLDLGSRLAMMTRLAACQQVGALMRIEPSVARLMPTMSPTCERLAKWLATEDFQAVRLALANRVIHELTGPRRLRPHDPQGEIEVIRALAMALTTAAGTLLSQDDVHEAFTTRSRMLVTADFVNDYLGQDRSAREEAEAMLWLVENVIGAANKRQAARFLASGISALRFETEFRQSGESPTVRLRALAKLQKAAARSGLAVEDYGPIQAKISEVGALVEGDAKLVQQLGRGQNAPVQRLLVLLEMAVGEGAPSGQVADRARAEALRMMRLDGIRAELAKAPQHMGQVRTLLSQLTPVAA